MRVTTWNCNLGLSKKFDLLNKYDSDVIVIQECEELPINFFAHRHFHWVGLNKQKGLGVIMNTKDSAIDNSYDPNLINFLPISTPDINILAVWAYNHRAKRFGEGFNGNTIDALDHYGKFLMQDKKLSLVVGDFNNSIIWDKGSNKNNFYQINAKLKSLGFLSNYHELENMKFGKESAATFFHTKKESKPYHIDYIYSKGLQPSKLKLGSYKDWIEYSDHVPLTSDFSV